MALKAGEKLSLEFSLGDEAFAFWNDADKLWTVEPGSFEILVGASSADIRMKETVELD